MAAMGAPPGQTECPLSLAAACLVAGAQLEASLPPPWLVAACLAAACLLVREGVVAQQLGYLAVEAATRTQSARRLTLGSVAVPNPNPNPWALATWAVRAHSASWALATHHPSVIRVLTQ